MSSALATLTPIDQAIIPSPIQPWDRQPEEPARWYDRFTIYRDIGPNRSIAETYRRLRLTDTPDIEYTDISSPPSTWYDVARQYEWERRACLFDDWINRGLDIEIKAKVRRWKAQAIDDMAHCWRDLQGEWALVEPGQMQKHQIAQSMKTIAREINALLPQVSAGVDVQIVLDKLPSDLQAHLAQALRLT